MGYFKAPAITTSARILSTWSQKELLYDTDLDQLFVCDGVTMGCNPVTDANLVSVVSVYGAAISNLASSQNALSNVVSNLNSAHNALSNAVSALSVGVASVTSTELSAVSAQAASAIDVVSNNLSNLISLHNVLSNRVSANSGAAVSVTSAELVAVSAQAASALSDAKSVINAAIDVVSNAVSNEISNRISADNALSNAISITNVAITSVDARITSVDNAVSIVSNALSIETVNRIAGDDALSNTLSNLLSLHNVLSNRVSANSATISVTSAEVQAVSSQAASALNVTSATLQSAINTVSNAISVLSDSVSSQAAALSLRIDSVSNIASILSSLISSTSVALEARINTQSNAISIVSNALSNEMSNRISADNALSNTVSVADAALSLRIDTQSQSISTISQSLSIVAAQVSTLSLAIVSVDNHVNTVSNAASIVSVAVLAEVSNRASADNVLSLRVNSVNTYLDNLSGLSGATSVKGLQSVLNALSNRISVIGGASVTSVELLNGLSVVSAQAASAINVVSVSLVNEISNRLSAEALLSGRTNSINTFLDTLSAKSAGGNSVKGLQSVINALSNRISVLDVETASVTSVELYNELSIVSAQAASALSVTNAAVSVLSLAIISVEAHVNTVSTAAANAANAASIVSVALALETSNRTSADVALSLRIDTQSQSISILSNKISAICAISAKSVGGSSVQGLQSVINALSNVISSSYADLDARQLSLVDRVSVNSGLISSINSVLNNVSVKSVGGTSVKGLQSVLNALSNRISAASGGVGSVTSAELQVVSAQAASALSVVEAALSSRVTSVNTLLNGISALSVGGTSVKGLQSVINALSNRISAAGAGSVTSVELNAVSAQAASAISVVSVQAASALSVVEAALSSRVTSVNTFLNGLSVKSGATSVKGLQSVLNTLSNRISAAVAGIGSVTSAELNAVSAQAASAINVVSNELVVLSTLVSNIKSAITNVSVKSVGGTSVKGLQSSFNALSLRIDVVAGGSVTSAEHISVDTRVTSVFNFVQGVSALSVGGTSVKGLQSVINALSNRISAAGAGSVTSVELQAVSAQAASAISVVNNAVSIVSVSNAAVSARVNSVNTILDNLSVKSVGGTSVKGLQSVLHALSNRISAGGGTASVTSTELSAGLALKADVFNTWKTISTAAHTFSAGDNDQVLMFTTNVTSIIATIPTGLSAGWHCLVYKATGSGNLFISSLGTKEGQGFTLSVANTAAALYHRGGDVHVVLGAEPLSTGLSNNVSILTSSLNALSNQTSHLLSVVSALSDRVSILSVQVAAAGAPQIKILGGQQVISTVTLTNISGFAVTVSAGVVYELFAKIMVNKPATAPSRWGLTFPAMTWSRGNIEATGSAVQAGLTISTKNWQSRWTEDSTGSIVLSTISTAGVSLYVEFEGVFKANAAGTIQLQAGGSTTTAAITILDGSFVKLYRLG